VSSVLRKLGDVHYYGPRLQSVRVKKNSRNDVTYLVYSSGKIVVTGSEDVERAFDNVERIIRLLESYVRVSSDKVHVVVENIVAADELGFQVQLNNLRERLEQKMRNVLYEPDMFPGLIYKLGFGRPSVLIFSTGRFIVTGSKTEDEALRTCEEIKREIAELIEN
ncbi:MAG: hypothetical protein ACP5IZ_11465, partial [Thermoprotei archaeon]